ncbi:DUF465 domain-containing protein [Martelella sp. HB161492]|uniref:YdcH family protein n=1 Tax=Martelella sp. HB161492 TaxID=2720726 RepID=UPI00159112EE|nr:DUF465 domain-containing protein [Martelella sp. HB161492]
MTVQTHIASLEEKHADLEKKLRHVMTSPSSNDEEISELKRRKLQLKDEMKRMQTASN